jgi:hypothetical protein
MSGRRLDWLLGGIEAEYGRAEQDAERRVPDPDRGYEIR